MELNKIIQGDCLEILKILPDNSIDSIITDPPYELGFMGKSWDSTGIANNVEMWSECLRVLKPGGHLLSFGGTRTYHRMACAIEDAGFEVRDMIEWVYSTGFPKSLNLNKALQKKCKCGNMEVYDKERTKQNTQHNLRPVSETDLSQEINTTKKQWEVLQSELQEQSVSFSGETTSNVWREQSSMERGSNIEATERQLQGSDLPKMSTGFSGDGEEGLLHNATQISDGSTPEQTTNENGSSTPHRPQSEQQQDRKPCTFCEQLGTQETRRLYEETYGVGSSLKPAHEPICLARKPLSEKTLVDNFIKYGTGGINIDESRVDYQSESDKASATPQGKCTSNTSAGSAPDVDMSEVDYNGERYWYKNEYKWLVDKWLNDEDYVWSELKENLETYDWCKVPEIDGGDRVLFDSGEGVCIRLYESKRKEFVRPEQLGRFPANLIHDNSEEVRECFPEQKSSGNRVNVEYKNPNKANVDFGGGIKNDYNDSGNASRFFKSIIYQAKASKGERNEGCDGMPEKRPDDRTQTGMGTFEEKGVAKQSNFHPTVKPLALMEYLIKMVTPKGGIVLDPFAGSGSTLVAAKQNGYQYIGIEMTEEYIPIIEARLKVVKKENTLF